MATLAELRRKRRTVMDSINKGSKYKLVEAADNIPNHLHLRRPSGIAQLDIDTGGGLPAGGMCYISGPDGAGKTLLLYNYFLMNQRIYGEESAILYVPVEFLPDFFFMRKIGYKVKIPTKMLDEMDKDRSFQGLPKLSKAERAELSTQVGDFHVLRTNTSEEMLDALLKAYASNAYQIIAVDSVSVLQASAEAALNTLADNPQQAANATLLTRFAQRFHPLTLGLADELPSTTLLFTAQVRANRHKSEVPSYMAKWMPDWATTGGANAMKHGKLIDIQLWSEGKEKEGSKENKRIIGKTLRWNLVKGKAGTHDNIFGEHVLRYDAPGDHTDSIVLTGLRHGVIQETNKSFTVINPHTQEVAVWEGAPLQGLDMQTFRTLLQQNIELELWIRRVIGAAAGVRTCLYRL